MERFGSTPPSPNQPSREGFFWPARGAEKKVASATKIAAETRTAAEVVETVESKS